MVTSILNGYSKQQSKNFYEYYNRVKELIVNSDLDINDASIVPMLASITSQMNTFQQKYLKVQPVLKQLNQISILYYNQAETDDLKEQGDNMFRDVLSSNECSSALSEIAYRLYLGKKFPIDVKPSYDMKSINEREAQIQKMFEEGDLTKDQAIYWSIMQEALSNSTSFFEETVQSKTM